MNRPVSGLKVLALTFALLSLLAMVTGVAFGQAISGSLVGTVLDSSGAAVPNAEVQALNVATGVSSNSKTGASGEYRFGDLLAGTYRLTIKTTGFRTVTQEVLVELNKIGTVNFSLLPGSASETVEVSGAPPIIDTTTAQIETTYSEQQLQALPTASLGLGVLNLSLLQAGVGTSGGLGAGTGPAIGGQRPRNNNFTIEGIDNNDKTVTGPLVYIPNDTVANLTILQNQFSPEFGHSNGGQFNTIVASGSNTFHGRAYEYFQNRNLNAIDYAIVKNTDAGVTPKNPRFDNNRFGGQVGGPIFKNKLFFFGAYEYNPIGQAAVPSAPLEAPTAAGYAQLLAIPGISAANVNAFKAYAQAGSPGDVSPICTTPTISTSCLATTDIEIGTVGVIAPSYTNYVALTTAMDYDLSSKDQIRGRYIYNKTTTIDTAAALPTFYTPFLQPYHLISLSEYHTFSPSVSNEFRVGYHRTAQDFAVGNQTFLPTLDAFSNITIDELGGIDIGPDPNAPQYAIQNLYQAIDNVTWVKGRHTLKFGIEGRKYIAPQKFIQRSRGDYEWSNFTDYVYDFVPDFGERSFGSLGYAGDQYAIYGFANDIWKITQNFSLNLGLRYEYTATPAGWGRQALNSVADAPGLITFGAPQAPKKDFMPRIGFAYSPGNSGNTSIRGGFGIGYDVLYDNIGTLAPPPQIGSTIDCPDATCQTPFLFNGGIPLQPSSGITVYNQADARALTSAFLPNNVKYPYSESWNLGIQRVFASNYTADITYVGSRGIHLDVQNRLNIQPVVTATNHLPTYLSAPSQATLDALPITLDGPGGLLDQQGAKDYIIPAYLDAGFTGQIVGFVPKGSSNYHALQSQLTRRFSNGLQLLAAWTWSHTIDDSTADFFSTIIAPRRPQDFQNLAAERANSVLDHAHRITISAIYEVPWYKHSSSWLARNLLGNYEFAPVFTWENGQWGTVQSGTDSNLNTDSAPDRAVYNSGGIHGTSSSVSSLTNTDGFVVGYLANDPNAQYIKAGQGALATTGRSTLSTPPINDWDMTLAKHFAFGDRFRIDLQAQMYNAFNHPQYVTGSINTVNSISDTSAGDRNYFVTGSSTFNNAKATFASNARIMQLGLKFIF